MAEPPGSGRVPADTLHLGARDGADDGADLYVEAIHGLGASGLGAPVMERMTEPISMWRRSTASEPPGSGRVLADSLHLGARDGADDGADLYVEAIHGLGASGLGSSDSSPGRP